MVGVCKLFGEGVVWNRTSRTMEPRLRLEIGGKLAGIKTGGKITGDLQVKTRLRKMAGLANVTMGGNTGFRRASRSPRLSNCQVYDWRLPPLRERYRLSEVLVVSCHYHCVD